MKWFKGDDTKTAVKLIEREASERYVEQVTSLERFQELFRELLALLGEVAPSGWTVWRLR